MVRLRTLDTIFFSLAEIWINIIIKISIVFKVNKNQHIRTKNMPMSQPYLNYILLANSCIELTPNELKY